jgi:hypothetical protein
MRFTRTELWQIFQQYKRDELGEGELRAALRCWPLPTLEVYIADLAYRDRWRIKGHDARVDEFPPE